MPGARPASRPRRCCRTGTPPRSPRRGCAPSEPMLSRAEQPGPEGRCRRSSPAGSAPRCSRSRRPVSDGADRQAVDQQGAGVVEEAFAFEDHQQPVRRPQLLEHGGGGRSVGRRDDGAERDGRRPRQVRHQVAGRPPRPPRWSAPPRRWRGWRSGASSCAGRAATRRRRRRPAPAPRKARAPARIEHQRRHAGKQREGGAGERHQRRVGRAKAAGGRGEDRAGQQQRYENLESVHHASDPGELQRHRQGPESGATGYPGRWPARPRVPAQVVRLGYTRQASTQPQPGNGTQESTWKSESWETATSRFRRSGSAAWA